MRHYKCPEARLWNEKAQNVGILDSMDARKRKVLKLAGSHRTRRGKIPTFVGICGAMKGKNLEFVGCCRMKTGRESVGILNTFVV